MIIIIGFNIGGITFVINLCLMEFVNHNIQGMIAIAPRREALETPIKDPTKNTDNHYYNSWTIEKKAVDNA
tara:strand:+ start:161 stop:373 length:213 start_codon:yes stop_codon:yes gene_type:complete